MSVERIKKGLDTMVITSGNVAKETLMKERRRRAIEYEKKHLRGTDITEWLK